MAGFNGNHGGKIVRTAQQAVAQQATAKKARLKKAYGESREDASAA
jgi:hypothetical protein